MPRSLRITLFLLLLLTGFSPPVLARMVIGITPAVMPGAGDPAVVKSLEQELSKHLGEPVQIRSFESEAVQLDWLIRFRELDAALIGHNLPRTLPAGTLIQLAELPSAVAVSHPGIAAARQETLGQAFRNLLQDERGRQLFHRLDATAKSAVAPASSPVRQKPRPVSPPPTRPAVAVPAVAAPAQSPAAPSPAIPRPAPIAAAQPVKPLTATTEPPARSISAEPVAKSPAKPSVAAPTPAIPHPVATPAAEPSGPKRTRLLLLAALVLMIGIIVKIVLLMRHWQQKNRTPLAPPQTPSAETLSFQGSSGLQTVPSFTHPPAPAAANTPPSPTMAEKVLAHSRQLRAAAVQTSQQEAAQPAAPRVTAAAKVKMRSDTDSSAPFAAPAESSPAVTENASPVAVTASPQHRPTTKRKTTSAKMAGDPFPPIGDDQLIDQGQIGKIKLPALFKRCAELPQPTLLRVRSGDSETCIHFAAGQICHAYSRNWRSEEETRQWTKLGYLMVRDGLLSETQRDQALELIERQPELRFAAALQQLKILDIEALRHILARQAKTTVFALILFSSGKYRIETDRGAIPAEESISLQSEALIREASHHQAEWTAIRKILPTLGTLLDFAPDGREKLEQVRLSVHQQLLLSQVDSQTSIGTLSSDSTMMDYEACRFLYLMVKAGVLRVVPAA